MGLEQRFAEFRETRFSFLDRLLFQNRKEILDTDTDTDMESESTSARAVRIARNLDKLNHLLLYRLLVPRVGRIILEHENRQPITVLDVCTGYGGFCRSLHKWAENRFSLRIVGIDHSDDVIRAAHGVPHSLNVQFSTADALNLPFKDNQFDLVTTIYSLHHFDAESVAHLLQESIRVGRTFFSYDLRRTVYGIISAHLYLMFSLDFVRDAVISNRRAYSVEEMRFLVREAQINATVEKFGNGMVIESRKRD